MATLSLRAIAGSCGIFPPLSLKQDIFNRCGGGPPYALKHMLQLMQAQCAPPNLSVQVESLDVVPLTTQLNAAIATSTQQPLFTQHLSGRYRLLDYELLDPELFQAETLMVSAIAPDQYRATIFDYERNQTLLIQGRLDDPTLFEISPTPINPLPNHEEFEEAVTLLRNSPEFGQALQNGDLRPFKPMPPLLGEDGRDGAPTERTLAVGLAPTHQADSDVQLEIVGVNMVTTQIVRLEQGAPEASLGILNVHAADVCDPPADSNQNTTAKGTPGAARVKIFNNTIPIWDFIVVRPAASSGTKGSGVELRFVEYLGQKVLHRAHVPILNVEYEGNSCGPYRDWQWQEGCLQANGTDPTPGFRLCSSPAQTILDTGDDTGNFCGVAIYVDGSEVVLVSEMEAGWYRYVSEWRFGADGTLKPRFGFTAVQDSCVCEVHTHHVYWRLHWHINSSANSVFKIANGQANLIATETAFERDPNQPLPQQICTVAAGTDPNGMGYQIVPGASDGVADNYSIHDFWVLRYHTNELDDGVTCTSCPGDGTKIQLDLFLNGETVASTDLVTWYTATFRHDEGGPEIPHIVGPELKPQNWPWPC